ncbi:MAG: hypothetical protein ACOC7V_08060, partial [Spirochaetota bacterium]
RITADGAFAGFGQSSSLNADWAFLTQLQDRGRERAAAWLEAHGKDLRRRGTRWNVFGITTHETFELDGGLTHFLEGRMDASFGTTPLAMSRAIRLMETGLVDTERIISHRFPLSKIHDAVETMGSPDRNKVVIQP